MKIVRTITSATFLACAALVAACAGDSATAPSEQTVALTQALNELSLPGLDAFNSSVSQAPIPNMSAPSPTSCTYTSATASFVCPNVTVTGLSIARSFTLLDASGAPQSQYDKATTAGVRASTKVSGTITTSALSLTVDQQDVLTLTGLLTGVHTLNGTSNLSLTGTTGVGTGAQPTTITQNVKFTDVVLPAPGGNQWPKSGTLALDASTSIGTASQLVHVLLTFNGTNRIPMALTINGLVQNCTIDLTGLTASICQ